MPVYGSTADQSSLAHSHGESVAVLTGETRHRLSRSYRPALEARLGQVL